jgi:hypothetical protein
MYLYEDNKVSVLPTPVAGTTTTAFSYIKKPNDISWGFNPGDAGQLEFVGLPEIPDTGLTTVNFELHESEQPEIVLRVLAYAGVIVKDPMIIQVASQQVQQNEINEKS